MRFDWDQKKAESNKTKHGIGFEDVLGLFFSHDTLHEDTTCFEETRLKALGYVHGVLVFVVYTLRDEEIIRLISARRASREERKHYDAVHHRDS